MTHTVEPTNPSQPADTVGMGYAHAELRGLKQRVNDLETTLQADIDLNESDADAAIAALQAELDAEEALTAAHRVNVANPHSVTATQVGLGNVDNTADADKPVSTAQQAAIDAVSPNAAAGFTATNVTIMPQDGLSTSDTAESQILSEDTWTSVGNSTSSETFQSSQLDAIPSTAKFILANVQITQDHTAGRRYVGYKVHTRKKGSTETDPQRTQKGHTFIYGTDFTLETICQSFDIIIPVDSSGRFEIKVDAAGLVTTGQINYYQLDLLVNGYLE